MEILKPIKVASTVIVLALGSMGLNATNSAEAKSQTTKRCERSVTPALALGNHLEIRYIYTKSCTRITEYNDTREDYYNDPKTFGDHGDPFSTYQYCDGGDFVDYMPVYEYVSTATPERTAGHAACADGKLTLTDFPEDPSTPR